MGGEIEIKWHKPPEIKSMEIEVSEYREFLEFKKWKQERENYQEKVKGSL